MANKREKLEDVLWGHLSAELAPEVVKYQGRQQQRPQHAVPVTVAEITTILSAAVKDKPVSQVIPCIVTIYNIITYFHTGFDFFERRYKLHVQERGCC
ncbi:MAG: hypothetical protein MJE68_23700 [Proteobacteria bacterium]|nr:hypothetical protein [Pseudomonadota bacterium]